MKKTILFLVIIAILVGTVIAITEFSSRTTAMNEILSRIDAWKEKIKVSDDEIEITSNLKGMLIYEHGIGDEIIEQCYITYKLKSEEEKTAYVSCNATDKNIIDLIISEEEEKRRRIYSVEPVEYTVRTGLNGTKFKTKFKIS